MTDFNFVNKRLATGAGINSVEDAQAIVASGITHVIDCRDDLDDTQFFVQTGVTVLWNGTADDGSQKPLEWFGNSLTFALPALSLPHNRVYAHCAAGVNRGPSTCYLIMRALGFSAEDAEAIIRAARPQVGLVYKDQVDTALPSLGYE